MLETLRLCRHWVADADTASMLMVHTSHAVLLGAASRRIVLEREFGNKATRASAALPRGHVSN